MGLNEIFCKKMLIFCLNLEVYQWRKIRKILRFTITKKKWELESNIYKLKLLHTNLVFEFYIKFKQFVWQKQIFMNYICLQTFLNGEYLQIILRKLNNLSSSYFPFNKTNLKTFSLLLFKKMLLMIFLDIMSK